MIIYLHGFGSNGNAFKARLIKRLYPNIPLYSPDLPLEPIKAIELVEKLINDLPEKEKCLLIGSSLGGFYALHLNVIYNIPAVLLNPTVQPIIDLKKRLENENDFMPNLAEQWNDDYSKELEYLSHYNEEIHATNLTVHLNSDDEILDYKVAKKYFSNTAAKLVVHETGEHVFVNFSRILPELIDYYNNL